MRIVTSALVAVLALAACTSASTGRGAVVATCAPVFFGVAGSGQGVQNPAPEVVPPSVSRRDADRFGTTVGLLKSRLDRLAGRRLANATAIDYPATPLQGDLGPAGLLAALAASEQTGVERLVAAVRHSTGGRCATRPVLLAGYSQGAEVVTLGVTALPARVRDHVTVALFGNPSYLPGKPGDFPGGTSAVGVRPALLSVAFQLPTAVRQRTIDICAPGDGVCNVEPAPGTPAAKLAYVLSHTQAHTHDYAFGSQGYAERAARFLWQHR
jgi:pimeloyl-ACP methyl ester carboxylesterase